MYKKNKQKPHGASLTIWSKYR